jgi:hypothetical protein
MADELIKPDELLSQIGHRPSGAGWMDTPVDIRKGMYCYASNPKSVETLGLPNARVLEPLRGRLATAGKLAGDRSRRVQGTAGKVPVLQGFHGHLRALRRLRRQVPLLHRHRRPKNMPVLAGRTAALVYRNDFTTAGENSRPHQRGPSHDRDVLKEWWYYFTSAPSAGAARCSAHTASTRPKSPSWAGR